MDAWPARVGPATDSPARQTSPIRHSSPALYRFCLMAGLASLAAGCGGGDSPPLVGTLERDRIEIIAEASEPIVALEVREGDHVAEGTLLMRLETATATARAEAAASRAAQTRHHLTELLNGERPEVIDEARARVAAAQATAQRDQLELRRVTALLARGLTSQASVDQARAANDAAAAALREAQAALALALHGSRIEDIDQARAALAEAEAGERQLAVGDARLDVRATRAGTVEAIPYKLGERPPAGAPVVVLLADSPAYARIYVPEPLRASLRAGQAAEIRVDGLEKPLPGRFRYLSAEAAFTPYYALTQRDRSRLSYLAEVEVTGPGAAGLPAGVPVEVTPAAQAHD